MDISLNERSGSSKQWKRGNSFFLEGNLGVNITETYDNGRSEISGRVKGSRFCNVQRVVEKFRAHTRSCDKSAS